MIRAEWRRRQGHVPRWVTGLGLAASIGAALAAGVWGPVALDGLGLPLPPVGYVRAVEAQQQAQSQRLAAAEKERDELRSEADAMRGRISSQELQLASQEQELASQKEQLEAVEKERNELRG